MKHWKAGENKPDEPNCDFERPAVCVTVPKKEPVVEKRAVVTREIECTGSSGGGSGSRVTIASASSCLEVAELSPNNFELRLPLCEESGADFDQCGIEIENGLVKNFARPVMEVMSSNGTVVVTPTACGVDLSVSGETEALPFRILCEVGPCVESGKAIGIVKVVRVGTQFSLEGCALAGEGATNATMTIPSGTYATIADAVSAMNGITLSASWGPCGNVA
ncbi:MAG: hypothetical protein ACK4XK_11425 [Casimicrobiaceae bacterium]